MNDDLTQLRAKALALLRERATTELTIEHGATSRSPLSKGRVLRLRVVRGDEPNGPHWAIALDESGEEVDIERLPRKPGCSAVISKSTATSSERSCRPRRR
jgi:hypothetical protein